MRRLKLIVLVMLAVLVTAQPVLHHHSLDPEGSATPCSVCAFGAHAAVHAPAIGEPLANAMAFAPVADAVSPADVVRRTSARAPPAA